MTSKQRKLAYIREKNSLRQGKSSAFAYIKMSKEMIDDTDFVNEQIQHQSGESIKYLRKKFKMDFHVIKSNIGIKNEDFTRDMVTIGYWIMVVCFNKH